MATIIVTIHAQPLPVSRPHATTNPAIPITISIPPIIPKNPPNKKSALRGIVTSVPLMFRENEEFDGLLLSLMLTWLIMGAKATNAIPPNKRRIPPIIASIAITVTPTGRFVSKSNI